MTVTVLNPEVILKARTIEVIAVVLFYLNFVIICQLSAGNTLMVDVKKKEKHKNTNGSLRQGRLPGEIGQLPVNSTLR